MAGQALHTAVLAVIAVRGGSGAVRVLQALDARRGFGRAARSAGRATVVGDACHAQAAHGIAKWRLRRAGTIRVRTTRGRAVVAAAIANQARIAAVVVAQAGYADAKLQRTVGSRARTMQIGQAGHAAVGGRVTVGAASTAAVRARDALDATPERRDAVGVGWRALLGGSAAMGPAGCSVLARATGPRLRRGDLQAASRAPGLARSTARRRFRAIRLLRHAAPGKG